jgi:hypothetical protein
MLVLVLEAIRLIQRAALFGFESAITALVDAARTLIPNAAVSCVTIESDHVVGDPLGWGRQTLARRLRELAVVTT